MGYKILVVEDQIITSTLLCDILGQLGFEVIGELKSGEDAISFVQTCVPDIILMDINLNGQLDGIEASKIIQLRYDLPIVFLTASSSPEIYERALSAYPYGFINKPFKPSELKIVIDLAVTKHRMGRRLKDSELRFRTLFDNAPVGIISVDRKGDISSANHVIGTLLQYSSEELESMNIAQFMVDEFDAGVHRKWVQTFFDQGNSVQQMTSQAIPVRKKDGTFITAEITLNHYQEGKAENVIAIIRDVSEQFKAEEAIKNLEEKEAMLKEIHHRVKNNMQIISSMLSLQEAQFKSLEAMDLYRESQGRIKAMALIHERLYQSHNFTNIDFSIYLRELATEILSMYPLSTKIKLQFRTKPIFPDLDQAIPTGLIVNEVLTNCIKYAFKGVDNPVLELVTKEERGVMYLEISDNGIGLPENWSWESGDTLGMKLIKTLSKQIRGDVVLESEPLCGTVFKLQYVCKNETSIQY